MFTVGAIALVTMLALLASRKNNQDRPTYDKAPLDDCERLLLLHVRQDLALISYLLCGVIVMLGIIADRLP